MSVCFQILYPYSDLAVNIFFVYRTLFVFFEFCKIKLYFDRSIFECHLKIKISTIHFFTNSCKISCQNKFTGNSEKTERGGGQFFWNFFVYVAEHSAICMFREPYRNWTPLQITSKLCNIIHHADYKSSSKTKRA